ncbi:hypothetical protein MLD38_004395 [Melastoma candidum]|uniref:Uncharacterized protein n=1 Tax=Melastoma candidum TaxID=119954 RepID=A0ACB9S9G0_9MYRT|nr:hypothetical protein MLD38_004395 [Melastoma candidum]
MPVGFRVDVGDPPRHHPHDGVLLQKQGIGTRRNSQSLDFSMTSLASIESLTVPLVQEVVLSADIRCAVCQKRVADVMSRMNGTETVVVNVSEKTVILSCKYPDPKPPSRSKGVVSYRKIIPSNKMAVIKRMFRSSFG